MPLEAQTPQLDSRTFEQLKRQALLRIPLYTPEWTDFNESDPGVTLIELFAWLTELMFYEMNRAPERAQIKFLQTLGLELQPAEPAEAHLVFTPEGRRPAGPVPQGAQFGAQPEGGGDLLFFETLEGLSLISLPLTDVQVFDGAAFHVETTANEQPGTSFQPFGWSPQPGSALYLGFKPNEQLAADQVFPGDMRWRVYLPAAATAGRPQRCPDGEPAAAPSAPVGLSWEYRPKSNPNVWRRLRVHSDHSLAFTREGSVHVEGPGPVAKTQEGRVDEERYWLRVRLAERTYPAGQAPEIDFLRPNVARVRNLATERNEVVGVSDGTPGQRFGLAFRPVAPDTLRLEVADPEENGAFAPWEQQDDLLASRPEDRHFVFKAVAGEITFGDGNSGLIPPAGSQIVARRYQRGGGEGGNVAAGMINLPLSALTGIAEVSNPRHAAGGRDEERIEDFLACAPRRLRHRDRAVARDDFATLAQEVGGVGLAKAIPLLHPDHPGLPVPGAITIVVVPDNLEVMPEPTPGQIEAVCRYLEPRRLLTTELHVKGPEYVIIKVQATVQVEPYASFDSVGGEIIRAINTSLDPLQRDWRLVAQDGAAGAEQAEDGQPAGCEIMLGGEVGRDLHPTSLYSVIQSVQHVRAISYLSVNGRAYDELRTAIEVPADGLLVGSTGHEIKVEPYVEEG